MCEVKTEVILGDWTEQTVVNWAIPMTSWHIQYLNVDHAYIFHRVDSNSIDTFQPHWSLERGLPPYAVTFSSYWLHWLYTRPLNILRHVPLFWTCLEYVIGMPGGDWANPYHAVVKPDKILVQSVYGIIYDIWWWIPSGDVMTSGSRMATEFISVFGGHTKFYFCLSVTRGRLRDAPYNL